MADAVIQTGAYARIATATTTTLRNGPASLLGVFVVSSSSGTIKVTDDATGSTTIVVNAFTGVAGTWYPLPFEVTVGLTIVTGGTIDCTVSFIPGFKA